MSPGGDMDEKLIAELLARLDVMTAKLGVAGEALWHIFVRQAVISAWVDVAVCALIFIAWWPFIKLVKRAVKIENEDGKVASVMVLGLAGFALAICTAVAITSASVIVTGIVNPEFAAFQKLVGHK